jgi:putative colanic acid biosysnthesis UDP-glucose lipid carrier transferase
MLAEVGNSQSILRGQLSLLGFLRMTLDPILIVGAFVAFTLAWGEQFDGPDLVLVLIVFSLTFPGTLSLLMGNWWALLKEIMISWAVIVLILLFFGYATKYLDAFNPMVIMTWIAFVPVILYLAHRTVPILVPRILAMEGYRTAVIVGVTGPGRKLAGEFASSDYLGVHVIGFFDDRAPQRLGELPEWGLKGKLAELPGFVKANGVEAIFVALPMASQRILNLLDELRDTTASIYFVPDVFLTDLIQARMDDINGIPVVAVCETPFYGVNGLVKRLEDVLLSALILMLISPLMLLVALAVKLSSPGPIIFRQRRYGLDGKEIVIYKFRTMDVMEDGANVPQATQGDPRVTRLGAFLRRASLDELPQFLNVLQGRMSIVGPRPHAIAHNETYRKVIKGYMVRHKVKPGITGLAQVNGLRGEIQSLDKMQQRVEFDLEYLRKWSLRLDLWIILQTALIALKGDRHAY